MRFTILIFSLLSWSLHAGDASTKQQVEQRIQPIGKVHVAQNDIQPTTDTTKGVTPVVVKKDPGEVIYEQHCSVCHRDGLAGAPKFQNADDWKKRLEGKKIEELLASSIKGLNAMPPKGTCSECSDDDLKAAINYMLPKQ